MVVDSSTEIDTDRVFRALSDATRRDIIRCAAESERSVSALAGAYPMSFAAVQKHVAVLERAGLITKLRRGREQFVRPEPEALGAARRALDEFEATWRGRVERMSGVLAADHPSKDNDPTGGEPHVRKQR